MMSSSGARIGKSKGHGDQDLGSILLAPLILVRKRLYRVSCWIRDEWRLNAAIRELRRLNDHYLDDIGINRYHLDLREEALIKRLHTAE
jgi:uncharacterized protein YjiS (DUF1127 family)